MPQAIISPEQLRDRIAAGEVLVFDCRHDLADVQSGRRAYAAGHVPGARFLHLDEDLSGPKTGTNGRHPLPDRAVFAARLRAQGLRQGQAVVAYDAGPGFFAARLWWMLRWMGHEHVRVLDGGWNAWVASGGAVSQESGPAVAGDFREGAALEGAVDAAQVMAVLHQDARLIVDARAADRFEGRNETMDPRGGHIPGAVNRPWNRNVDEHQRLLAPGELRAQFEALLQGRPASAVILQCGSGVTACHNALAMHQAGLPGALLYPGSWSEWVSDASRPIATGPA